jgi:outer membrane protein assembly factor BamB
MHSGLRAVLTSKQRAHASFVAGLLALLTSVASAQVPTALSPGWPQHRGDPSFTSVAHGMKPRTTSPGPKPRWSIRFPPTGSQQRLLSSPVVDATRGAVWVTETANPNDVLHVVDAATGKPRWSAPLNGFRDVYGSYPTGVLLEDGSLITSDRWGVYRVKASGGMPLWAHTGQGILTDDVLVTPTGLVIAGPMLCGGDTARAARTGTTTRRRGVRSPEHSPTGAPGSNNTTRPSVPSRARASAPKGTDMYFALDVATGKRVWGVSLPSATSSFCSSALLGPVLGFDPLAQLADGALWVTTAELTGEGNMWFAVAFNASSAWVAGSGTCPGIGNDDINDNMNLVLPGVPSGAPPAVILPYYWGDESCWPKCPPRGLVLSVDPESGTVTTLPLLAEVTDAIGECGAWSVGRAPPGSPDPRALLVLASSGTLYAFAPSNFTVPLWTYSVANKVAGEYVVQYTFVPPSVHPLFFERRLGLLVCGDDGLSACCPRPTSLLCAYLASRCGHLIRTTR